MGIEEADPGALPLVDLVIAVVVVVLIAWFAWRLLHRR